MALVGGGGAGNTAGSGGTAGTGQGLNHVGDRVFAYSGVIIVNNVVTTLLEFTTGSEYIVADFQFQYYDSAGDDAQYTIQLNGEVSTGYSITGGTQTSNSAGILRMILSPYTKVVCTARNSTDTSNHEQLVTMTGRVYA